MNAKKKSSLGLESIGDLSELLDQPEITKSFGPLELALELIDEDPDQPRTAENPGFSSESIAEIGQTIKDRGVKSPISVREHPEIEGRYIINHGARRYRGSKWAGKKTIPVFIDNDYNHADQVIENLQRNELTPREIADFIGRELAMGKKKGAIAKEIGKSAAFVTQHVTLLDLPEPIALIFNTGRVRDVTVINELVTVYKKNPSEVETWLDDDSLDLTRGSVKLLREYLDDKKRQQLEDQDSDEEYYPDTVDTLTDKTDAEPVKTYTETVDRDEEHETEEPKHKREERENDSDKLKKAIVRVLHDGRIARLVLSRRPTQDGYAWVKYDDDGNEFETDLDRVQLIAVLEG
ncbi:transcriptional repressor gene korB [Methylotuvimicrobium sp.]|uniref:transcriptional repressor gene korB n=1 Tax=Methylotuvimicrobium sp. TaxID=2822413 RepID=UPI003D652183